MNAQTETKPAAAIDAPASAPALEQPKPRRARRILLMIALPVLLLVGASAWWVTGGRYETTENANLHQARINVASDLSGRVVAVGVTDGEIVKRGATMFQVDPEPYRLALAQAETAVDAARLQVEQLKGGYAAAQAQAKLATDEADYQAAELSRQESLAAKGATTTAALDNARNTARRAREQATVAEVAVTNANAALGGDPDIATDEHPAVAAALAARDRAQYQLDLTEVTAPMDGLVYQATSFKPGQMVTAGTPLFTLLPAGDVWVDANFKETQLTHITAGEAATVVFDADPGVTYTGTIEAVGAGTGSEFSLLPAQNATGNWVKVTQRVPVRIRLDTPDAVGTIVSGMSAKVSVDTGQSRSLSDLLPAAFTRK